jgi:hypothetical protein
MIKRNFILKKISVNKKGLQKMAKKERKKIERLVQSKKTSKGSTKAKEYTGYLLELNKLQSILLRRLYKEVQ